MDKKSIYRSLTNFFLLSILLSTQQSTYAEVTDKRLSTFPSSSNTSSVSGLFTYFSEESTISIWRDNLDGNVRIFVFVQPSTNSYFFCPSGTHYKVVQSGTDFVDFKILDQNGAVFCSDLRADTTFIIDQTNNTITFDETKSFNFTSNITNLSGSISVLDQGVIPPPSTPTPTPTPTPGISLGATPTPTPTITVTPTPTPIVSIPVSGSGNTVNTNTVETPVTVNVMDNATLTCKGVSQKTCDDLLSFNSLLDWAEVMFPEDFFAGTSTFSFFDYLVRYYYQSGLFIGLKNGRIYAVGGPYGDRITNLGTIDYFLSLSDYQSYLQSSSQ